MLYSFFSLIGLFPKFICGGSYLQTDQLINDMKIFSSLISPGEKKQNICESYVSRKDLVDYGSVPQILLVFSPFLSYPALPDLESCTGILIAHFFQQSRSSPAVMGRALLFISHPDFHSQVSRSRTHIMYCISCILPCFFKSEFKTYTTLLIMVNTIV